MTDSLGLSADGTVLKPCGLLGAKARQFEVAMDALKVLNAEFLSRCYAAETRMVALSDEKLAARADLNEKIKAGTARAPGDGRIPDEDRPAPGAAARLVQRGTPRGRG
jgi:hypothetical protein